MRRLFLVLMAFTLGLAVVGCKDNAKVSSGDIYNAEKLKGIGELSLGLTTFEVETVLKNNAKLFGKKHEFNDPGWSLYTEYLPKQMKGVYEERDAKFNLSENEVLDIRLALYNDSLVIIRITGRWLSDGAGYVRDVFEYKFGKGEVSGHQQLSGRNEVWRSEYVTATYHLEDDENPDYTRRKILEFVEIVPTNRSIKQELRIYSDSVSAALKAIETERHSSVINIE